MAYTHFNKEYCSNKEKTEEENLEISLTVKCGEYNPLYLYP